MADSRDWRDWVAYAEDDWGLAQLGLERFPRAAAFELHEAAEKYLKAVLVSRGLEPGRTHDLKRLLETTAPGLPQDAPERAAARLFDLLFPPGRYPGNIPDLSVEQARALERAAGVLRALARRSLGLEP